MRVLGCARVNLWMCENKSSGMRGVDLGGCGDDLLSENTLCSLQCKHGTRKNKFKKKKGKKEEKNLMGQELPQECFYGG